MRADVMVACSDPDRSMALCRAVEPVATIVAIDTWPTVDRCPAGAIGRAAVLVVDPLDRPADLRAVADLVAASPALAVLAIGAEDPPLRMLVAMASGAVGYLPMHSSPGAIATAVTALLAGDAVLPRALSRPLVDHLRCGGRVAVVGRDARTRRLTSREWEVLVLVCQGRTTREIAAVLVVSVGTVRTHVAALLHKLGACDRDELVRATGLVPDAARG